MRLWEDIEKGIEVLDIFPVLGTGYFARLKNYMEMGCSPFSIARYVPKGINIPSLSKFFPSEGLLREYKSGCLTRDQYIERYYAENLDCLNPFDIVNEMLNYNNPVLVCYEKTGDFCHRHIISDWLKTNTKALAGEIMASPARRGRKTLC